MKKIIWALFGNDDDGIYGDLNFNPSQQKTWWIAIKWWLRNPFHNFTFYVIGLADIPESDYTRRGRYPFTNFNPYMGWNFTAITYKWLWLPFISYEGEFGKFYIGWRDRGAFGFKLTGWLLVFFIAGLFIYWWKG